MGTLTAKAQSPLVLRHNSGIGRNELYDDLRRLGIGRELNDRNDLILKYYVADKNTIGQPFFYVYL